jgi:anhydro-N-acetylmuramic acid kinase
VIAQRLGVPVVSDFRAADVAVGGQGAPLVPYADWCLLTHPRKTRAVQNLGGIANVTFLPVNGGRDEVVGFDTGPGNMLIDRAAAWATGGEQHFDRDGLLAAQGQVRPDLMALLLDHPFLRTTPPKSSGREAFGEPLFRELLPAITGVRGADVVATMTEFTARTVADAYRRFLPRRPDEVIVGGGGARNPTLMGRLRAALDPTPVLTHEDVGMHGDAKEAIAFALLANETLLGNPGNLPSVTGASRPVLLGKLTLP